MGAWGQTEQEEILVWDGTTANTEWYTNGPGEDGAYHISTAADLAGLAQLVDDDNTFEGKTIYLDADIKLNNTDGWKSWNDTNKPGNEWKTIGSSGYFSGIFDGQNHTISGIYINNSNNYQGLFGHVDGTIQNLSVTDSYIKSNDYVGGIVGYSNGGTVSNCFNSGTMTGEADYASVGGIVGGNMRGSNTVSNCFNSGTVTGGSKARVGGIVGFNDGSTVSNCSNIGTVTGGSEARVGGIVGYSTAGNGMVTNCSNIGEVIGRDSGASVGGIVGYIDNGNVSNCYYYLAQGSLQGVGKHDGGTVPSDEKMKKTEDEFKNGTVAYLLGEAWGQRIGTDDYPVLLSFLSEDDQAACKIYSVTFTYKETPDAEKETEVIQYGNNGTAITAPTVNPVEGYIFAWDKEVPTQFGMENVTVTGTFTKEEEPEPEEPTEPEEPDVPHITYYDIHFVQPNDSVSFDYRTDQVREGNTFSFSASVAEGYDPKTLVVEYRRGPVGVWREVTLDSDGKYHVRANYADLYIRARVSPLVPTGVEAVGDEAIEVYALDGALYVYTPERAKVAIIDMNGAVLRVEEQVGKRVYTGLADGVYVARVGERSFKVRL